MAEPGPSSTTPHTDEATALRAEIARLNKMVEALMNRVEQSAHAQGSDFSLLQTTVMLEEQVQRRTADLEAALRANEAMNQELRRSEARFRGLANQSMVGIGVAEQGLVTYINPRLEEMYGYSLEELQQMDPLSIVVEEDRPLTAELARKRWRGELDQVHHTFRARRKDGAVVNVEIHGSTMRLDSGIALISMALDITERVRVEKEVLALQSLLREQSIRDALTGLYNRRHLEEALARELSIAQRYQRPVSLVIADVDHFKAVNDQFGHPAGDEVLRQVAGLLKSHARTSDIFCRYGGEEFMMVMPGMPKEAAVIRAEQLRQDIAASAIRYGSASIPITSSFGVASYAVDGHNVEQLIAAADKALYAAKHRGRNQVCSEDNG